MREREQAERERRGCERFKIQDGKKRDRGKSDGRGAMAMISRDRIDYLLMMA